MGHNQHRHAQIFGQFSGCREIEVVAQVGPSTRIAARRGRVIGGQNEIIVDPIIGHNIITTDEISTGATPYCVGLTAHNKHKVIRRPEGTIAINQLITCMQRIISAAQIGDAVDLNLIDTVVRRVAKIARPCPTSAAVGVS